MRQIHKKLTLFVVVCCVLVSACNGLQSSGVTKENKTCGADYDIGSIKDVTIDKNDKYASNEIEIVVDVPIDKFFEWSRKTPLEEITGGRGTKVLNDKKPDEPGFRRVVCSNDGHTAVEEFIEIIPQKYFLLRALRALRGKAPVSVLSPLHPISDSPFL